MVEGLLKGLSVKLHIRAVNPCRLFLHYGNDFRHDHQRLKAELPGGKRNGLRMVPMDPVAISFSDAGDPVPSAPDF